MLNQGICALVFRYWGVKDFKREVDMTGFAFGKISDSTVKGELENTEQLGREKSEYQF